MREWQALTHYRQAVIAGSIIAPSALVLSGLCMTLPFTQGTPSAWATALSQLGPASLILSWIVVCTGISFLPIGLFFLATRARAHREFTLHLVWVLLCALGLPMLHHHIHNMRLEVLTEEVQPTLRELATTIVLFSHQHGHPPASLQEVHLKLPEPNLRGQARFWYEVNGPGPNDWRLKLIMPGSLDDGAFVFLPSERVHCKIGSWHTL